MPLALRETAYWLTLQRHTVGRAAVLTVVNPLLFLVGMGVGVGAIVDRQGFGDGRFSYLEFLAPGLLAASMMQAAFMDTAMPVFGAMHWKRTYRTAAHTPLSPTDVLLGHLLFVAIRIAVAAAAYVAVMFALGATSTHAALLAIPSAVLLGISFAAPAAAWAVSAERSNSINLFFRFALMPMYMFSGTFFDVDQLPSWLSFAAKALPLWHGVELCRQLTLGTGSLRSTSPHVLYLLVTALLGLLVARVAYRRRLHS